jgi:plastocyanin
MRFAFSILLVVAACGGSSSSTDAPSQSSVQPVICPAAPAQTVTVTGTTTFAFSPMTFTINVNDVVHFNTTSMHPVASGAGGVADGKFSTNGDACFKFTAAGTFPFFCQVHGFTGAVTVH